MNYIGRQIEVGLAVEAVRGTGETVAADWLKKISATIVPRTTKANDESTRNVLADSLGTRITQKWIEGELSGNVHVDPIGFLLYNIYGSEVVSTLESGVYQHAFAEEHTITKPSLTIFSKEGAVMQNAFANCMVGSLELTAAPDQRVAFNASFTGVEGAVNADTPAYDQVSYDFVGRDVTVKVATTEGGLGAAPVLKLKELNLSWDLGLISDFVLSQYEPQDVFNSQMAIEGSFTINAADSNWLTLFTTDVYRYMLIEIEGTQTIGLANNPTLRILLNKVAITDRTRDDSAGEVTTENITFKAFFNEVDGQQSEVTLINVTSNYDLSIS